MKQKQQTEEKIVDKFKIIGATTDDKGGVVWICRAPKANKQDDIINIPMGGGLKERKLMWQLCSNYISKYLVVEYDKLDRKKFPINPIGIRVVD